MLRYVLVVIHQSILEIFLSELLGDVVEGGLDTRIVAAAWCHSHRGRVRKRKEVVGSMEEGEVASRCRIVDEGRRQR